jgi:DNA modification methylase
MAKAAAAKAKAKRDNRKPRSVKKNAMPVNAPSAPAAPPPEPRVTPQPGIWPADQVERRAVRDLLAYPRNARTHSPEQVAQLVASMREFGWTTPLLVDEQGVIIAGHGRLMAAHQLGVTEVPAMVARGWSDDQKRAYRIADNAIPLNAGWDQDALRIELHELKASDYDLALTGFGDVQLVQFMAMPPTARNPDAAPEPPGNPVTKTGDIWLLGKHRLLCGDATDGEQVKALYANHRPHLMVTDPPYGVDYDADWRSAFVHFVGDVVYAWHADRHASLVQDSLHACDFEMRCQIIWAKERFVISRGDYHWQHEPCWYAVRKGKPGQWSGDRSQSTLWTIAHVKSETGHSTQKPIECMKRPIENNSRVGDAVYDPFVGSGTTIIASELTGRVALAMEIDPIYCDVVVLRWQTYAKGEARLEATGQTFTEVAAKRLPKEKGTGQGQRPAVGASAP